MKHIDAGFLQHARWTNTRHLQNVRRADGPCRQNHFSICPDLLRSAIVFILNANCFFAFKNDAFRQSMRDDSQVVAMQHRLQVRIGRTTANTSFNRHIHLRHAFLPITIVVFSYSISGFITSIDKSLIEGVFHSIAVTGMQRTTASSIIILPVGAILRLLVVG